MFTECDPPYSGYFRDGRPQILFERHVFHRLTGGRFDVIDPDISNAHPGGYGSDGSHQYDRLKRAMALDESAAIQSASWGMGQTLGSNFKALGYGSPQDLAPDDVSKDLQLEGMVREIHVFKIAAALAAHDWKTFASSTRDQITRRTITMVIYRVGSPNSPTAPCRVFGSVRHNYI